MDRETKQALLTAADMQGLSAEFLEVLADAERYRWLRDHGDSRCTEKDGYGGQTLKMGDSLDAAVDAAMAAGPAVGAA